LLPDTTEIIFVFLILSI